MRKKISSLTTHCSRLLLGNLWQKALLKIAAKRLIITLALLYALYILIDLSLNYTKQLSSLSYQTLLGHYLHEILKRLPQVAPFALVITTTQLLLRMHAQRQCLALLVAGWKPLALLTPFLRLAALLGATVFLTYEGVIYPTIALEESLTRNFTDAFGQQANLQAIALNKDLRAWLVFRSYDEKTTTFQDAFIIYETDKWSLAKSVTLIDPPPSSPHHSHSPFSRPHRERLKLLDHCLFERSQEGEMIWKDFAKEVEVELPIDRRQLLQDARCIRTLSLFELKQRLESAFPFLERNHLRTFLFYRALQPLHGINATLLLFPCILSRRHFASRRESQLLPLALGLILLSLYTIVFQAGLLLASSERLSPYFALVLPVAAIPLLFCFLNALTLAFRSLSNTVPPRRSL